MILQRIKSEGLAHNSYYLGSGREAAVIDPRRDCDVYVQVAAQHEQQIVAVLETHRNEDYVIGSRELAEQTGCAIHHGAGLDWGYGSVIADGEKLRIGNLTLLAISTPGHTDESMSYVVEMPGRAGQPLGVFSGDALFVHDVGRVDFYGPDQTSRLAAALYSSLFDRLLPLGDGVLLFPAHGAGSVCARAIAGWDESTLGLERLANPWLQLGRAQFVDAKVAEHLEMAPYFKRMERLNLDGAPLLGMLPNASPLSPRQFEEAVARGAVVVDTRDPASFSGAHIPGALSVWLEGLPAFAGWLLAYDQPILLVLEDGGLAERAVRYLVRLGYDSIVGYLREGIETWYNDGRSLERCGVLGVQELQTLLGQGKRLTVLDVREESEWAEGHIAGSLNIYVGHLQHRLDAVPRDLPLAVVCGVGRRASIGCSILQRAGCTDVSNVLGGMTAWEAAGLPVESG